MTDWLDGRDLVVALPLPLLRRKGYLSRLLVLHGKFEDDKSNWRASIRLPATQDSFAVLGALDAIFPRLQAAGRARAGGFRLRMIGVTLAEIAAVAGEQGSLFAALDPDDPLARVDVTHFAHERGVELIEAKAEGAILRFVLRAPG